MCDGARPAHAAECNRRRGAARRRLPRRTRDAGRVALEPVQQLARLCVPDGRRAVAARRRQAAPLSVKPDRRHRLAAVGVVHAVPQAVAGHVGQVWPLPVLAGGGSRRAGCDCRGRPLASGLPSSLRVARRLLGIGRRPIHVEGAAASALGAAEKWGCAWWRPMSSPAGLIVGPKCDVKLEQRRWNSHETSRELPPHAGRLLRTQAPIARPPLPPPHCDRIALIDGSANGLTAATGNELAPQQASLHTSRRSQCRRS